MNAPHVFDEMACLEHLPCTLVRGGTSKGVFLQEANLPTDPVLRDRILLELMGSPDPRQINGLGGADPLTSKVAIVSRSQRKDIDVEYESLEVGIAEARINHGLMCGNLLAGVGYFAMAEGMIPARTPITTVRIYCRSNQKTVVARVPVTPFPGTPRPAGSSEEETPVELLFPDPQGPITGRLLPAMQPVSRLSLGAGRQYETSIVDAGTLYAFFRAEAFGLHGQETPAELEGKTDFRCTMEGLRAEVARHINDCRPAEHDRISPQQVKLAIFGPPARRHEADIAALVINKARVHQAFAVSGGIALAAAAAIDGTLVNEVYRPRGSPFELRIRHPGGSMALRMHWSSGCNGTVIHAAEVQRSARIILRGTVYLPLKNNSPDLHPLEHADRLPAPCVA